MLLNLVLNTLYLVPLFCACIVYFIISLKPIKTKKVATEV